MDGVAYEKGLQPTSDAPLIMPDIQPYISMADGTLVEGRAQHREMLKRNNCVEVGNEALKAMNYYDKLPDVAPQQRKEIIRAQFDAMTHRQFRAALKADADRVKWNSRED